MNKTKKINIKISKLFFVDIICPILVCESQRLKVFGFFCIKYLILLNPQRGLYIVYELNNKLGGV